MALDSEQPVTRPGGFGTFDNITSVDYVNNNLAVKIPSWKKDASKVVTYEVMKPFKILEGPVGPQIDGSKYLKGGGTQLQLKIQGNRMDYIKIIHEKSLNK